QAADHAPAAARSHSRRLSHVLVQARRLHQAGAGRALKESLMSTHPIQPRDDIPGWGVDADPDNDPTFPMRDQSEDDAPGMNWARPGQQRADGVEVLRSIEHERMPAVFGTSV